jgi:3-oxoadipate enol-lactonase
MRVRTRLGDLYVDEVGEGPAILFWHSFLHHGGMFRAQVEALRSRFRVLSIDAPGHGRSAALRRSITMEDCAGAVVDILDTRAIDRASFVGLSWGGMVAMALGLQSPARLSSLALLDTSCRREPLRNRIEYQLLGAIFRKAGAVPPLMEKVSRLFFAERTRREHPELVDEWFSYVARLDGESVWNALQCIVGRPDSTPNLARISAPSIVIVGAQDVAQPVQESQAIAAALPGARLVVIPEAAHLSALERPREVNEVLVPFLERHASRAEVRATT